MTYYVTARAADYIDIAARAAERMGRILDIPATLTELAYALKLELQNRGISADVVVVNEHGTTSVIGGRHNDHVRFIVDICSVWEPNRFGAMLSARYAEVTA